MKLSEKIQEALREQQEINLSDPAAQKRLAAQWGYVPAGAQPAPSFADAYQGAMEEVAIWKKRALEAEDLNRKFVAEINGPTYMGEPAQSAPSVPREAIEKMLTQLMDIAVCNGANSISMPDEYVEVAAWLCGIPAQPAPNAVAYLDLGVGGYMDVGTDLTDEELATLPKGRHMLGVIGTYGVDGYVPAQPAPSVPDGWQLVPVEPTSRMLRATWTDAKVMKADGTNGIRAALYRAMLNAAPEAKPDAP